jgi:hypothetical protein
MHMALTTLPCASALASDNACFEFRIYIRIIFSFLMLSQYLCVVRNCTLLYVSIQSLTEFKYDGFIAIDPKFNFDGSSSSSYIRKHRSKWSAPISLYPNASACLRID